MKLRPRPFLKWVGGKRRLLGEILPTLPTWSATYYEPFVGGGAVFFALAAAGRFGRAVLSDANPELIATYQAVRDHLGALVEALRYARDDAHDLDRFAELAGADPGALTLVERAARFVFLNRTAYGGLYRVNRDGGFNVGHAGYERPRICDVRTLAAASEALQGVELVAADFAEMVRHAGPGDGVYLDPPYVPSSASASFTAYTAAGFGRRDHRRVAHVYRAAVRRGARVVLSNSAAAAPLYAGCASRLISADRRINCRPDRRGPVPELLVTGLADTDGGAVTC